MNTCLMDEKKGLKMFLDKEDDFERSVTVNARKKAISAVLAMSERNIVRIDLSIVATFF